MLSAIVTRWISFMFLAVVLFVAPAHAADVKKSAKVRPIAQIDRTRAVGAPVLDDQAKPGLYVWLEDGAFHLAAVPAKPKAGAKRKAPTSTYSARVTSTKTIKTKGLSDFRIKGAGKSIRVTSRVGTVVTRGRFETEGNVTITGAKRQSNKRLRMFVGPLAKPAAATLKIGRFSPY